MKKYVLCCCLVAFSFGSCCKKTACPETHTFIVKFYGFTKTEVDTIYVTGYAVGSGFAQITREVLLDTAANFPSLPRDVFILNIKQPTTRASYAVVVPSQDTHEWKLFIPAVNRTIRIYNYGYNTYNCNSCGLRRGEKKHSLSTCSIDDSTQYVDDISVYK